MVFVDGEGYLSDGEGLDTETLEETGPGTGRTSEGVTGDSYVRHGASNVSDKRRQEY